jgi:hypothetical protein
MADRLPIDIHMTPDAATKLSLGLAELKRLNGLTGDLQELMDALNYALVGDPASEIRHRRMEAGKGMTPDGGK